MARRRLEGLERVLGANALFSTAYGNVGSSIYYALGLVASFALGLTPVVFVITGVFFFCTAATYAEATTMYPEAGGSSSFARRAFNEFWSFFAAWGQMLNYVITVAISAFFVPHYLGGLFWEPLRSAPGDIIFGAGVIVDPAPHQRRRRQGVRGAQHPARGRRLPHTAAARPGRRCARAVPVDADRQRPSRRGADLEGLHPRDPDRDDRLYGHRDDLEHGRGGQGRDEDDPGPSTACGSRCSRSTSRCRPIALSALPVERGPDGEYRTLLGLPEEEGGYRRRPDPRRGQADRPRAAPVRGRALRRRCSPRRSCSSPPTPA